ncbi:hypothetical protein PoMZ_10821 [Pyricularia oryzae]|uniref:Uncharacterized protein n=1 Tax=Pyricularia oryzae TaxID=318829 RepID=A0A4V1C545_PYROR|nr:hypothetical protein PoMZ_10821 [Pyricularia oryzae]
MMHRNPHVKRPHTDTNPIISNRTSIAAVVWNDTDHPCSGDVQVLDTRHGDRQGYCADTLYGNGGYVVRFCKSPTAFCFPHGTSA